MKKNPPQGNQQMTKAIKCIKGKVNELPSLTLPIGEGQLILETDALDKAWSAVLLEKADNKENICSYASGSFHGAELNYPSSHKAILAVKKAVKHFRLYLKPLRFIIRTNLKIMPGIFKNENLMAENNSRILKWFVWLQNFDFDIKYKTGYLNCLVDMLTMEFQDPPSISMFSKGEISCLQEKDFR